MPGSAGKSARTAPRRPYFPARPSRADTFTESVIREMTRLSLHYDAINLAQGFPDFPCPPELKTAACAAVTDDYNQYAITWGAKELRGALAERVQQYNGMSVDPEAEITVTCGSTEAMMASMLATIQPGNEVIVPEPFYENYGPDSQISGAVPRYVGLGEDFSINEEEWKAAISKKSRAIILNTPNNPTGKVFTGQELSFIADLCIDHNMVAITDEIYEHILYDGRKHISIGTLDGMRGPDHHHREFLQDLQRDRVAGRVCACRQGDHCAAPEDPRLPDGRGPRSAPAGMRGGTPAAGVLLPGTCSGL